jgi:hypothetical protein
MGNQLQSFTSVEKIICKNDFWTIYEGYIEKENVTIFYHDYKDSVSFEAAKNGIQQISVFRHDSILKFKYKEIQENYVLFATEKGIHTGFTLKFTHWNVF